MAVRIADVSKGSVAEEVNIEAGDILLKINNRDVKDILDYQFYTQDDYMELEIEKPDGEIWLVEIEKDFDEELGLGFDEIVFDKMKVCRNHCIFCFIDQLPKNMRKSLYIKDDDYRYSFLFGNFITMTNLKDEDWQKIINMHLSPLYVSIHCMRPELRARMLNNPRAARIREDLSRLADAGIEIYTQIVLCPGINDGDILRESIEELRSFYPTVQSIGIVPVGLTGYRQRLAELRTFTAAEAREIIDMVGKYQDVFRHDIGFGLVYLADEFFIKAGRDFPPGDYYDDYTQIENGIGLARIFLDDFAELEPTLPQSIKEKEVYLITGISAVPILDRIVKRLNQINGMKMELLPVENSFFGGSVTVTGLLTGSDIINKLGQEYAGKKVIIPEVVLKEGNDILLDDKTLDDIREQSQANIITVDGSAESLVRTVLGTMED